LKRGTYIWITLLLAAAAVAPLSAQEVAGPPSGEQFFVDRAFRDATYEHELRFSRTADEIDFWNDQRAFEQRLFQANPLQYRAYLQGKRLSYREHQDSCKGTCGHGDYYLRQASFYLQYDSGDEGDFLTLTQLEGDRGWEVSYAPANHK
jgi:hypothetical protein